MKSIQNFTAIIEKEDDVYVALCPELDIASQGNTVEEAKANLHEAIELFFEHASKNEIEYRLKNDIFITNLKIEVEQA
ncbi:MAG: type II toxin-antitoxin system HicB family antitoxin [Ginsengibacter sp.]